MAWSSDEGFYEGFWTDWTRGSVRGKTLTLCPTSAIILTNSLAMFVTLCSIQTWAIVRYVLHLCGPKPELTLSSPQIAQQLILRNTGSAITTALLTIEMIWDYRTRAWKVLRRPYVIVVWAAIYAALFTTAGVFSNKAISAARTDGSSAVLLRGELCGTETENFSRIMLRDYSDLDEFNTYSDTIALIGKEVQRSLQYAQQCYMPVEKESDRSSACSTLKNSTIRAGPSTKGSCPVDPNLCSSHSEAITFDTGYIDSHEDLGFNADQVDRLKYRRITTCAILNDTGRILGWDGSISNSTMPRPQSASAFAYYGPSLNQKTPWTYAFSNFASFYDNFTARVTTPYQLDVEVSQGLTDPQWTPSDFEPISEIAQADADLTMVFLSFTGMYLGEIDDPWFSAHQAQQFSNPLSFLETRYTKDQPISTVACTERHNICTADGICTDLLGFDQIQNVEVFNSKLSPHQMVTFDRLLRAIVASRIANVVMNLSQTTKPLTASLVTQIGNSGGVISSTLPQDQWKREFEFWHAIAMAQLQRSVVLWATGQNTPAPQYLAPAKEEADIWFCNNVIVPSNIYQSFSVLSIVIIIVFGTVLIAISVFMDSLVEIFAIRFNKTAPGKGWKNDGMLVLQRRKTKGDRRSILSRGFGNSMNSPRHALILSDSPRLSIPVPNSARISSQLLPKGENSFILMNSSISPATLPASGRRPDRSRMTISSNEMVPISKSESGVHAAKTLSREKTLPPVPPSRISLAPPTPAEESSPRALRILDWMKTLHPRHPAHARGAYNAYDPEFG